MEGYLITALGAAALGLLGKIVFDWLKTRGLHEQRCRFKEVVVPDLNGLHSHVDRTKAEIQAALRLLEEKNGNVDKTVTVLAVQIGANQREMVSLLKNILDELRRR